ncbi:MFS transporter [Staphylococcus ratti]|uniref:MFS transporter n=1 Tax=Staphylococcus ratti TaxID=2892440 RepID=A0ABY3PFK3_9STAP|nr:MFS transporter [Staphylococcus ratti]UEX91112.1 MFS transporter [Staphylococcus ratti]
MPVIGNIIDRHHNKSILLLGQIVSIISLLSFILFYNHQYQMIFILMILLTVVDVTVKTIVSSNLKWITGDHLERVVSLRQLIQSSALLVSPIVGGILISILTIQHVAIINIITELLALIFIFLLAFKEGVLKVRDKTFGAILKQVCVIFIK